MKNERRRFLAAGSAVLAAVATPKVLAQSAPFSVSQRYPDPLVRVVDPSFGRYRIGLAKVERIASGCRWNEGPVWFGDSRTLIWSDIPNNRMMKWDEESGHVGVFRKPSNNGNGNTRDRQGRLITCEHDTRRVTRTEYDGSITVIADKFDGKPLNSPNDVVCKSDGSLWFTDPPFGILGFYEGQMAKVELPTNVYRWDPQTRALSVVAGDIVRPNGLAFSPDEKLLYVIEAGATPNRVVRVFDVASNGRGLANSRVFLTAENGGTPDGFRVDVDGNLWMGWGMGNAEQDGVSIFNKDAKLIGRIDLPERCANLCFGGRYRNRLLMTAATSVYSLYVNTQGVLGG